MRRREASSRLLAQMTNTYCPYRSSGRKRFQCTRRSAIGWPDMSDAHYRFERILVERRDAGIVVFTINRPERMNATDDVLHREFALLPRRFDEDDAARVAVLTEIGRASCRERVCPYV